MKQQVIIFILLLTGTFVKGQPTENQCFFSEKRGMIFSNRLLLLYLDSNRYLIEYYTFGGGLFSGPPSTDTLLIDNGLLRSNMYDVTVEKNRMIVKSKERKRKFKYQILDKCDSTINLTRNWPIRETIRYRIKDNSKSQEFGTRTEPLLKTLCFNDFVNKMREMEKSYELTK